MEEVSLFKDWKCRTSSLGHILTKENSITEKQLQTLKELEEEKRTGLNKNGNKVKWTDNKEASLQKLYEARAKGDELPDGVKTHLDNVFRSQFWGRKRRLVTNKLEKGTECEPDSLLLLSDMDDYLYKVNNEQFENDYITGEPDNFQRNIKEIKSNWDLESFEKADLTHLYKWQVRGYCWLAKKRDGELVYCLVNNPFKQFDQAIYYLAQKFGEFEDGEHSSEFIKEAQQIERNMIFDIEAWKEQYPNYTWHNTELDFHIPKELRIKRFEVELFPEHISFIKTRVELCREYLMEKEKEVFEKLKAQNIDAYYKLIETIIYKNLNKNQ